MLRDGEWADMVVLHLTASVLGVDIVLIPAFRESSIHQGLGRTVIRALDKPKSQSSSSITQRKILHVLITKHLAKSRKQCGGNWMLKLARIRNISGELSEHSSR